MRGKSPLVIMELCVMLLVFAIAAALCLGCFALAENISSDAALRDRAGSMARNCAEAIIAGGGDFDRAAELLDCEAGDECLSMERGGLFLSAREVESGHPLLGLARVSVRDGEGRELFALDCPWQKGGGDNG